MFFYCLKIYFVIKSIPFSVQRSYLKTGKVMETAVLIGKVIESYNCEHFIKLFIELAQFTHEIFVDFDLCCSDCDLVDFLVGACLCINMLGKNVDKKFDDFDALLSA